MTEQPKVFILTGLPAAGKSTFAHAWCQADPNHRDIVNREGGKFLRFTIWGKKKTMYPVAKQPRAIYVHAHYLGGSALVAEVERNLRNFDEVSRFLSRRLADDIDPETRQPQEDVKLAGDVDDNKPFGGAEREDFGRDEFGGDDFAPENP